MAEPSKDNDQSMEDILQSIKRIIADEGEPVTAAQGSDVLELTELLAEDAAVAAPPPPPPAPAAPKSAQDDIDALFASAPAAAEPEPVVAPPPAPPPPPSPVAAAPAPVMVPAPAVASAPSSPGLMSDSTLAASVAALHALSQRSEPHMTHDSPVFRSGATVEDLVVEALKPMLREWLDGNLPSLVRTLVEKEIQRLNGGH